MGSSSQQGQRWEGVLHCHLPTVPFGLFSHTASGHPRVSWTVPVPESHSQRTEQSSRGPCLEPLPQAWTPGRVHSPGRCWNHPLACKQNECALDDTEGKQRNPTKALRDCFPQSSHILQAGVQAATTANRECSWHLEEGREGGRRGCWSGRGASPFPER